MALSQDDRLSISEKLVDIPREDAAADNVKEQIEANKEKFEKKDEANKNLQDDQTALINPYQKELTQYDGNGRTEVTEQDIVDSANKVIQNPFFPNDPQNPIPSLADGVWKNFPAFALSKAIGKDYFEAFSVETKEQDKIDAVNAAIAAAEALIDPIRSSGQECAADNSGTCSGETPPGSGVDEATCLANGGAWTPSGGPDNYTPSADAQQALDDLVLALNDWKSFVTITRGFNNDENSVDDDTTRQGQNNTSIADIDDLIAFIDNYLTIDDFDTTTSLPSGSMGSGCSMFGTLTSADFLPSKLRDIEIQTIKDEIAERQTYITTRQGEVQANLGSISQDVNSGEITSASGFYSKRYNFIDLRLNLVGGTKNIVEASERGLGAQDELKASNARASNAYGDVMYLSSLKAPAAGTGTIHVQDGSGFSVGDTVYIAADKQSELTGTIQELDGNRIVLDINIPKKYTNVNKGRVYKLL
jgi:hypothetical protein